MNSTFITVASMAVGVLLSPEIFIPGMWVASLKGNALQKAWLFFVGGVFGLAIPLLLGFFLSSVMPDGPSWTRFFIRAGSGFILISLGLYSLLKRRRDKKQSYERYADKVSPLVATGLGFFVTGLNLKIISLSVTAGHQVSISQGSLSMHIAELLTFFGISLLPLLLPAMLETMKRGVASVIMTPCNNFLEKYGRWVVSAILFVIGGVSLKGAFAILP